MKDFLGFMCAGAASIFRGLENDNVLAQGWHITSMGTYYGISKGHDDANLNHRYYLGLYKNDQKKMLTFMKM